jgi:hypothetical protein
MVACQRLANVLHVNLTSTQVTCGVVAHQMACSYTAHGVLTHMLLPAPFSPVAAKTTLAGDHLQLPPTVMSEAAAKAGLSNTLFERLQGSLGPAASCMLTVQYRMNAAIMDWSSQELYGVSCCSN